MSKTMIVYYSWSGRTAALAHQLQQLTQADTYELKVPAGTFSQDMDETSTLAKTQRRTGKLPAFTQPLPDLAGYDLILVGGPVWCGAPAKSPSAISLTLKFKNPLTPSSKSSVPVSVVQICGGSAVSVSTPLAHQLAMKPSAWPKRSARPSPTSRPVTL